MTPAGTSAALQAVVRELEAHAAESGWDRPERLFALVPTAEMLWRDLIRLHTGNQVVLGEVVAQMRQTLAGQGYEGETEALVATVAPAHRADATS